MCIMSFILGAKSSIPMSAGKGRNRERISSPMREMNCALSEGKQSRNRGIY